jgi:hypothetical protein
VTSRPPEVPALNVIPLTPTDKPIASGERGDAMRAAVVQVMTDLAVERVPLDQRSPLFDAARELLTQAGRSPVEMLDAVEPGPEQDSLFEELGLGRDREE